MPTAVVPGAIIYYEMNGEGPPLLLARGYGSHSGWWEPSFLAALRERFTVIVYDHRGTGRSRHLEGDYTIPALAGDAVCLLEALGTGPAHVYGHSMGGMVAQELALGHPYRVDRLVLGATHCGGRHAVMPAPEVVRLLASRAGGAEMGGEWLRTVLTPGFARRHADKTAAYLERAAVLPVPPEVVGLQADAVSAFDTWDRLSGLRAPTLVLHGGDDLVVPPANARVLGGRIPGARVEMLAGMGHDFTVQDPAASAALLTAFLNPGSAPQC
jgi:3-oxoadipate enol-lactonase